MKIILHGATNGSNFGDYLFADIFWRRLKEVNSEGENIFFEFLKYGISDFFKKNLEYKYEFKKKDIFDADLLIYFSGGYFGESALTPRYWRISA